MREFNPAIQEHVSLFFVHTGGTAAVSCDASSIMNTRVPLHQTLLVI